MVRGNTICFVLLKTFCNTLLNLKYFYICQTSYDTHYPRQPFLTSPNKMMTGRYILQVWIFFDVGDSCLSWFALHTTTFWEKFVNFRFVQIFHKWWFSCGNDETSIRTHWFFDRIPIILAIQVCIAKTVMLPPCNQRLLSSSLFITMIHICARFCSFVLMLMDGFPLLIYFHNTKFNTNFIMQSIIKSHSSF